MRRSLFLFLAIFSFWGCGGGSSSTQSAKLRVIAGGWAVPSQGLTVTVNGATVVTDLNYPSCVNQVCQELSNYITVKSGGISLAVTGPGSTTNLVPSAFQNLNLSPNTQNTFVLGGSTEVQGYLFTDNGTPTSGSVNLRMANADGVVVPYPVSAWVNPDGNSAGSPLFKNIATGSASSYLNFAPGSYIVTFSLPCPLPGPANCITVGPSTFAANQNVTVYVLNESDTYRPLILADN